MKELSLEVIRQITEAEKSWEQRKAEAVQAAKRSAAEAEKAGQAMLEQARSDAEAKVKAALADAEAQAAEEAQAVQDETVRSCNALKAAAEQRLEQAAQLIVRRVVKLT